MSNTDTSDVGTAASLSYTVPSDPAPSGTNAAVLHSPVGTLTSAPVFCGPVATGGLAESTMPDVRTAAAIPLSSADQL